MSASPPPLVLERLLRHIKSGRQNAFDAKSIWQIAEVDTVAAIAENAKAGCNIVQIVARFGKASEEIALFAEPIDKCDAGCRPVASYLPQNLQQTVVRFF